MRKIKITDTFGNDLLDEQGCVQYKTSHKMTKDELIKTVESLLSAVEDDCLSPEDFMERLNDTYKHFGEVTHENMKGK